MTREKEITDGLEDIQRELERLVDETKKTNQILKAILENKQGKTTDKKKDDNPFNINPWWKENETTWLDRPKLQYDHTRLSSSNPATPGNW